MAEKSNGKPEPLTWAEERDRFRVLHWIYQRTGADCTHEVTGPQIGAALQMTHEELFAILRTLDRIDYIHQRGLVPHICITPRGIRFIESEARGRESVRS